MRILKTFPGALALCFWAAMASAQTVPDDPLDPVDVGPDEPPPPLLKETRTSFGGPTKALFAVKGAGSAMAFSGARANTPEDYEVRAAFNVDVMGLSQPWTRAFNFSARARAWRSDLTIWTASTSTATNRFKVTDCRVTLAGYTYASSSRLTAYPYATLFRSYRDFTFSTVFNVRINGDVTVLGAIDFAVAAWHPGEPTPTGGAVGAQLAGAARTYGAAALTASISMDGLEASVTSSVWLVDSSLTGSFTSTKDDIYGHLALGATRQVRDILVTVNYAPDFHHLMHLVAAAQVDKYGLPYETLRAIDSPAVSEVLLYDPRAVSKPSYGAFR